MSSAIGSKAIPPIQTDERADTGTDRHRGDHLHLEDRLMSAKALAKRIWQRKGAIGLAITCCISTALRCIVLKLSKVQLDFYHRHR
jgi:hypothetical protein